MATITYGSITITIPDDLSPPEKAGKMSPDEVSRIPKAPRGIGLACDNAADAMTKAGAKFTPPGGITPAELSAAGERAEKIDQVISDAEVIVTILKQANLLFDADAWEKLRKVNDQVKVQSKHEAELGVLFKTLIEYFARGPRKPAAVPEGGAGGGE